VFAAPVAFDRGRTPGEGFRVIAINSGNANACTGRRGLDDARAMAAAAAEAVGADESAALVLSTGIIGEFLPLEKIRTGIKPVAAKLGSVADAAVTAARGMMTTDTRPKLSGSSFSVEGRRYTLFGMAIGGSRLIPAAAVTGGDAGGFTANRRFPGDRTGS
ncbi:MAG: bifunctional ornithine acetyltransferase/N-acetylglutamate synthase, partial [Planctomycetia bacterium]